MQDMTDVTPNGINEETKKSPIPTYFGCREGDRFILNGFAFLIKHINLKKKQLTAKFIGTVQSNTPKDVVDNE